MFRELRVPNEDGGEWDLDSLDDSGDSTGDAEEHNAGGAHGFFGRALVQDDALHDHGRYCRPYYYIPDRETGSVPVPLSPESSELVSQTDVQKRMWKSAAKGQAALLRACVRAGADPDLLDYTAPFNHTAVLWAARGGHVGALRALAELGADFEVRDRDGQHALHIAARWGHLGAVEAVVDITDGNLYARDDIGRTALHAAAVAGRAQVVAALAARGSNVNAVDHRFETPLHLAARMGRLDAAKMMVRLGADLEKRNALGHKPIDVAEKYRHKKVYYFLEECMGEKCVFDRKGGHAFYCGQRHPHKISELAHRRYEDEVCGVQAGGGAVWEVEGEKAARSDAVKNADPATLYKDPTKWEQALKQEVDLFPEGDQGGAAKPKDGGGFDDLPAELGGEEGGCDVMKDVQPEGEGVVVRRNVKAWIVKREEDEAAMNDELVSRVEDSQSRLAASNARRHARRVRRGRGAGFEEELRALL
ncbi:ankyrin repeat-containing domain protein [Baffinella frigidus]|nr:ankyrin repeat-containing domain protein [Cryptophyta sp. CCMP2293]